MVSNHSNEKGSIRMDTECSEDEYFQVRCSRVTVLTFELCKEMGCYAGYTACS